MTDKILFIGIRRFSFKENSKSIKDLIIGNNTFIYR